MTENTYLCHFGIKGQKKGMRKYQNPDGTWTEEGKARRRALADAARKGQEKRDANKPKEVAKDPSKPEQFNKSYAENDNDQVSKIVERERKLKELDDIINSRAMSNAEAERALKTLTNDIKYADKYADLKYATALEEYRQKKASHSSKNENFVKEMLKLTLPGAINTYINAKYKKEDKNKNNNNNNNKP